MTLRESVAKAKRLSKKTGGKVVFYVYQDPDSDDPRGTYRVGDGYDLEHNAIEDKYIVATSHD